MGQYFLVVNIDRRQFIDPTSFGDSSKLLGFVQAEPGGVMTALSLLLANSNPIDDALTWAGDRVVIAGDYAGPVYDEAQATYEDISYRVMLAMARTHDLRGYVRKRLSDGRFEPGELAGMPDELRDLAQQNLKTSNV